MDHARTCQHLSNMTMLGPKLSNLQTHVQGAVGSSLHVSICYWVGPNDDPAELKLAGKRMNYRCRNTTSLPFPSDVTLGTRDPHCSSGSTWHMNSNDMREFARSRERQCAQIHPRLRIYHPTMDQWNISWLEITPTPLIPTVSQSECLATASRTISIRFLPSLSSSHQQ